VTSLKSSSSKEMSFSLKPLKTWLEFHYMHFKEKKRERNIVKRTSPFFKKKNNKIFPK